MAYENPRFHFQFVHDLARVTPLGHLINDQNILVLIVPQPFAKGVHALALQRIPTILISLYDQGISVDIHRSIIRYFSGLTPTDSQIKPPYRGQDLLKPAPAADLKGPIESSDRNL
ncbi:MAG: hypothetical protein HC883_02230 [Bdellovibrionaceae bacterium]|nr:hypothetical protein [Pseudobdellovibrionaceae bacterium]